MGYNILCIVALDGQSSNHVMNYNLLQGLMDNGHSLYGVIINNYSEQYRVIETSNHLFRQSFSIDGRTFDYGSRFFLLPSFEKIRWGLQLVREYRDRIAHVIGDCGSFCRIISFASPIHAHYIAYAIIREFNLDSVSFSQFWSDPLSGSMMDYRRFIPIKRFPIFYSEYASIMKCKDNIYGTEPLFFFQKKMFPKLSSYMRFIDIPSVLQTDDISGFRTDNRISIGYFGTYQSNIRNIEPLVRAAESLERNIQLIICGDGNLSGEGFGNIKRVRFIKKRIPYKEAHEMEMKSDILVSVGNLHGCQMPGKTFYYAGLNKPIIYVCDGLYSKEHKEYLEGFNRYIICNNTVGDIQNALNVAVEKVTNKCVYHLPARMHPGIVAEHLISR